MIASAQKRRLRSRRWQFTSDYLASIPRDDPARAFCELIVRAPAEHNRFAHLAARRHAIDHQLAADPAHPYVFSVRKAARPIAFCREFSAFEGPLTGKPFELLAWQRFIVSSLFGWRKRADPRRRRFNYAYNEVAKKNGKTPLVAPLGLFQIAHPPPGSRCEVYSTATALEQAKLTWKDGLRMLRTSSAWARNFRERVNRLIHGPSDSEWRPLGGDKSTLDGLRPELAIMDELHAWTDAGLWGIINAAFGAAFSPLILQITTAGDDVAGVCREQRDRVVRILDSVERGTYRGLPEGSTADEGFYFGIIFTLDKGDRWDDETKWVKANPSLGVVKSLEDMRKLASGARSSATARRDFMVKQLNVWQTTGPQRWLDLDVWEAGVPRAAKNVTPAAAWARLRGLRLWCGMDLASTTDTSSFCAIADDPDCPGRILAAWLYWLPDKDLVGRCGRDHKPYDLWAREGWLELIPGPVVDVNQIERDVVAKLEELAGEGAMRADVGAFAYDPGWAQGSGQRLQDDHDLPMLQCPQRYSTMSSPLFSLERMVIARQIDHAGNPIAAANVGAATTIKGQAGGILLAKARSTGRIDGLAALAMAIAARDHDLAKAPAGSGVLMA